MKTEITLPTDDGDARAFVFTPNAGAGPWPGAILIMDAPAIRPAMFEMGERLAAAGYYVILPDMFWRAGPYDPPDIKAARAGDPAAVAQFQKLRGSTGAGRQMTDVKACLEWLAKQPQVRGEKVGITGYCMGGGIALAVAAAYPARIGAAASFHGGGLATDEPDSPHLGAPRIKAKVYIGWADDDPSYPPEQAARMDAALAAAGVDFTSDFYPGALHGWTMTDFPVYDEAAAERHWDELRKLFAAGTG